MLFFFAVRFCNDTSGALVHGVERNCLQCTVYVSAYGFKGGDYSIVASKGLTRLKEGFPQQGTLGGSTLAQFYEFYNPPGEGDSLQVFRRRAVEDVGVDAFLRRFSQYRTSFWT